MSKLPAPESCAICGAEIPAGARSCPECGADERTGWREQSLYDGLDLPDNGSDPEHPTETPFTPRRTQGANSRFWWITAAVMLVVIALLISLNRF